VLIPELDYITNDAWALASGSAAGIPYPLLLQAKYAGGYLYVLTVPENFGDLYNLPEEVLNPIRTVLGQDVFVRLEGPSQVAVFAYDNRTFIVESFLPVGTDVKVCVTGDSLALRDLVTGAAIEGKKPEPPARRWRLPGPERISFDIHLPPHSYRVFAADKASM